MTSIASAAHSYDSSSAITLINFYMTSVYKNVKNSASKFSIAGNPNYTFGKTPLCLNKAYPSIKSL